jgi:putative tricarboxylic transport membrane protein
MAPPRIRPADLELLSGVIDKMAKSPAWQDTLSKRGWLDLYQPRDEFTAFVAQNRAAVEQTLTKVGLLK